MIYIHGSSDFELDNDSAVTLGKFDGVHTGHQKLIEIVKTKAKENDLISALFTFDGIPLSILPQKNQHFITTNAERRKICEDLELDVEIEYPFTNEFMNMDPDSFIKEIIIGKLHAKVVVVGTDYMFGKNRSGNVELLAAKGEEYGFETIIVEKEKYQDKEISSTYVRDELKLGHMETVNILLNRPYSVSGIVSKGNQIGRTIDFPTANIYPAGSKLLPPNGVYASSIIIDGNKYFGVSNLGTKPTVSNSLEVSVETHIFNYDKDIYGAKIEVEFMHFIRPEMKFEDVEALQKQILNDSEFAKSMFLI